MQDTENCKVTVHSNAHKLLFGDDAPEVKVKQGVSPLISKESDINKRKHRAPQLQKASNAKANEGGYSQKYLHKKVTSTPGKDEGYSPLPPKGMNKAESDSPLFHANPLPSLHEEIKDFKPQYNGRVDYQQLNSNGHHISNYDFHNQNARNMAVRNGQPHETKKANFEQNRRSNITNVSNNIVSSREKRTSDASNTSMSSKINHTQNTNKGYVKMTTMPQYDVQSAVINMGQNYYAEQNQYPTGMVQNTRINMVQPEVVAKGNMGKQGVKDSILQQYSHNLPPHQIEYKSGFQDIPPPMYNPNDDVLYRKAQAKPLPGNNDLADIDFYRDLR